MYKDPLLAVCFALLGRMHPCYLVAPIVCLFVREQVQSVLNALVS